MLAGTVLDGVSLSGANLFGADLAGASLRCTDLFGANLFGANLPGATMDGADLRRANLASADISGASLRYATPADDDCQGAPLFEPTTRFNQADLSGTTFGLDQSLLAANPAQVDQLIGERAVDLHGVNLAGAIMNGTDLIGANLQGASLVGAVLLESDFTRADLTGANALGAIFGTGTTLAGATFVEAQLQSAIFVGVSSYAGAIFDRANLTGASMAAADLGCQELDRDTGACRPRLDGASRPMVCPSFRDAQMQGINLLRANLAGVDFGSDLEPLNGPRTVLENANLFDADLSCTDLTETSMLGAQLTRAAITHAIFHLTSLELADLTGVDFSGLTLTDVDLSHTNPLVAASWEGTVFEGETVCANEKSVNDESNGGGDEKVGTCFHPIFDGSLLIDSQADADAHRDISGVNGDLVIAAATSVTLDFYGLRSIRGDLLVLNTGLTHFGAMPRLHTVTGSVRFEGNPVLVSIGALGTPDGDPEGAGAPLRIGRDLNILTNGALTNVDGLSGVTSIGGYLKIQDNTALPNLDGLSGLTSIGGDLTIHMNLELPTCQAENLVTTIGEENIGGPILISGNDDTATCQ